MKKIFSVAILMFALLLANASFAQIKKTTKLKQEEPKKTAQKDSTKGGTRMAINSAGLPTKGKKSTSSAKTTNGSATDPKKDEPKKEEVKKTDEKK